MSRPLVGTQNLNINNDVYKAQLTRFVVLATSFSLKIITRNAELDSANTSTVFNCRVKHGKLVLHALVVSPSFCLMFCPSAFVAPSGLR